MEQKTVGAQTRRLRTCPSVLSFAAVGGRFEGEGPLREYFDELSEDHFFGEKTWEKGESTMQRHALSRALEKGGLKVSDLDLIFAGDLLNQCVGSSFALRESRIPFYGLYGACSTMGESLSLAALMLDGGYASCAAALTSSHFCTAERQYRMPVPLRLAAHADRAVDGHRQRLLPPRVRGRGALYHTRDNRENRRQGRHRRKQHGRGDGPRRL